MSKFFTYKEIADFLTLNGFEFVKASGSHCKFENKGTGSTATVPNHPAGVSIGVGESVIQQVLLNSQIVENADLNNKKISNAVLNVVDKYSKKFKTEGIIAYVNVFLRQTYNLNSNESVDRYIKGIQGKIASRKKDYGIEK